MLVEWCNTITDQGNFRAPNELVQVVSGFADLLYTSMSVLQLTFTSRWFKLTPKAMALADKYCQ